MKYIITEQQHRKFLSSSPKISDRIKSYLNKFISKGNRKIGAKSRNYGNLREDWCVNGNNVITAAYYFENNESTQGNLLVSTSLINQIRSLFNVRKSYALQIIEEWYDETMVPQFEKITGENTLNITDISEMDDYPCIPEPIKPEGITDEEMIEYIINNTAYTKAKVIDKIESGERDLEDFYLDVVETVERKKQLGF